MMGAVEIKAGEIIMRAGGTLVGGFVGAVELGFGAFEEIVLLG